MELLASQILAESRPPLHEIPSDTTHPPDPATATHKSPPYKPPAAAVPTKYAASKYAHAESTSPAARVQKFEQWEDRLQ
jgi:hypothetical protein